MATHKFLASGARGPISGFAWPRAENGAPGTWVEIDGPLAACARGVHGCRPIDLAHWIHDELWELETDGDALEALDCIVVPRARLVRRVDAWDAAGQRRFTEACVAHAAVALAPDASANVRDLLDDARYMATHGYVALAAFTAAVVVGRSGGETDAAYRRERAWQSAWITRELIAPT